MRWTSGRTGNLRKEVDDEGQEEGQGRQGLLTPARERRTAPETAKDGKRSGDEMFEITLALALMDMFWWLRK